MNHWASLLFHRVASVFAVIAAAPFLFANEGAAVSHARMVVLTDIEADPDDTQSLVRLLLYANSFDIEAIVATTKTARTTEKLWIC